MSPRGGTKCFVFYCLVHLSHLSLACILLLNGWSPLTVYERSSLADIVAVGEVLHAFKNVRTNAGTYTAEVRVLTVHKGAQLIQDVLSKAGGLATASVFNISNFGDKAMCYADVRHGEMYIFFLTVFRNRLSAKYDDVFGAAAEFSEENERQVLDYLGKSLTPSLHNRFLKFLKTSLWRYCFFMGVDLKIMKEAKLSLLFSAFYCHQ